MIQRTILLKKELDIHFSMEKKLQKYSGEQSDDSDVYEDKVNSDFEDEDDDNEKEEGLNYFDYIEKVFVTFNNMHTKDKMERLYSSSDENQNNRWLAQYLTKMGCGKKSNNKCIMQLKRNKWKHIMASSNIINN